MGTFENPTFAIKIKRDIYPNPEKRLKLLQNFEKETKERRRLKGVKVKGRKNGSCLVFRLQRKPRWRPNLAGPGKTVVVHVSDRGVVMGIKRGRHYWYNSLSFYIYTLHNLLLPPFCFK